MNSAYVVLAHIHLLKRYGTKETNRCSSGSQSERQSSIPYPSSLEPERNPAMARYLHESDPVQTRQYLGQGSIPAEGQIMKRYLTEWDKKWKTLSRDAERPK